MRISKYKLKLTLDKSWSLEYNIKKPSDVAKVMKELKLVDSPMETMYIIGTDNKNNIIGVSQLGIGSINSCMYGKTGLLQTALLFNACGVIVAHNHPSGDLTPSVEDIKSARLMRDNLKLVGIELLDSIIVNILGECCSIREEVGDDIWVTSA